MTNEKEWFDKGIFKGDFRDELIDLLHEQRKRDLEEFREMLKNYEVYIYRSDLENEIDAKLNELG